MSLPFSNTDISLKPKIVDDDEDSVVELGQIAILGTSRPSLKHYKSSADIEFSKRSLSSRNTINNSRLFVNKFGSRTESILGGVEDGVEKTTDEVPRDDLYSPAPVTVSEGFTIFRCFENVKGYIYGIISALVFVLSQVIMRRSLWLSGPDHVFIRLLIAFIIFYTYLKYNNLGVLGPKEQLKLLMFRGFLGKFRFSSQTPYFNPPKC